MALTARAVPGPDVAAIDPPSLYAIPRSAIEPWVEAGPFRSHLRFLMAAGGLSAAEVAVLAGLAPRFTSALLVGRAERPVRRISPEHARRLLRLTPSGLRAAASCQVPARLARRPAELLMAAGWTLDELAGLLRLSAADTAALLADPRGRCGQLVAVRAVAQVAVLGLEDGDDPSANEDDVLDLVA